MGWEDFHHGLLAFGNDDFAAEGSDGDRRAAVSECGANRPVVAPAPAPTVPIAVAADDHREIGSNRAAEAVRGELETGRVREREAHAPRVRVDLVAAAFHEGARVLDAAAHRLDAQAIARDIAEHDVAADRAEVEPVRLQPSGRHASTHAGGRQIALGGGARERHVGAPVVAGDVVDADPGIAADLHLPGEPLGLFRPVAALVGARTSPYRVAPHDPLAGILRPG